MTRTNQLQQKLQSQPPPPPNSSVGEDSVLGLIKSMEEQFAMALPEHVPIERFMRVAITVVRTNDKLKACTRISLLGALMQAAQQGLEPGLDGQCYLIPRKNKKTNVMEVHYQRGYQGDLELARRSGEYSRISVKVVRENDEFDFEEGSNEYLKFKRKLNDRGNVIAFYCLTELKGGGIGFTIMSVAEVEKHRDDFASTRDTSGNVYGVWEDHFESMGIKTVLLKHLKYQPKSYSLSAQLAQDNRVIHFDQSKGFLEYPALEEGNGGSTPNNADNGGSNDPQFNKEEIDLEDWKDSLFSQLDKQSPLHNEVKQWSKWDLAKRREFLNRVDTTLKQ